MDVVEDDASRAGTGNEWVTNPKNLFSGSLRTLRLCVKKVLVRRKHLQHRGAEYAETQRRDFKASCVSLESRVQTSVHITFARDSETAAHNLGSASYRSRVPSDFTSPAFTKEGPCDELKPGSAGHRAKDRTSVRL